MVSACFINATTLVVFAPIICGLAASETTIEIDLERDAQPVGKPMEHINTQNDALLVNDTAAIPDRSNGSVVNHTTMQS